jgi:hypothetical protein
MTTKKIREIAKEMGVKAGNRIRPTFCAPFSARREF